MLTWLAFSALAAPPSLPVAVLPPDTHGTVTRRLESWYYPTGAPSAEVRSACAAGQDVRHKWPGKYAVVEISATGISWGGTSLIPLMGWRGDLFALQMEAANLRSAESGPVPACWPVEPLRALVVADPKTPASTLLDVAGALQGAGFDVELAVGGAAPAANLASPGAGAERPISGVQSERKELLVKMLTARGATGPCDDRLFIHRGSSAPYGMKATARGAGRVPEDRARDVEDPLTTGRTWTAGPRSARFALVLGDDLPNATSDLARLVPALNPTVLAWGGVEIANTARSKSSLRTWEPSTPVAVVPLPKVIGDPSERRCDVEIQDLFANDLLADDADAKPLPPPPIRSKATLVASDNDANAKVLQRNIGQLKYCHEQAHRADPKVGPQQFNVSLLVKEARVTAVALDGVTNAALETCVTQKVQRWIFPVEAFAATFSVALAEEATP